MTSYKKIGSIAPVVEYLVERITNNLHAGKQVLWLVCGGSAEAIAIAASQQLHGKDARLLTITLTDERFGPVGHADSNWQQLLDGGFTVPGAVMLPVLEPGEDRAMATEKFNDNLRGLLQRADYCIGLFGIGPDGHTAGILPHSPAVNAAGYATSYKGPDYQRITMTPHAIAKLDEAVVYAVGQTKWAVVDSFDDDAALDAQPAQILKNVPLLTICSDRKGDIV